MGVLFDVTAAELYLAALVASSHSPSFLTPAIRFSSPASRTAQTEALTTLLDNIDETRSRVARLEEHLAALIYGLERQRDTVVTALAPVSGMPTEILREIFMIVAESDRTSKARILLSHVSSGWRAVSLGLRELWTVIQAPPRSSPKMVHEFARRSGDLRLELSTLSRGVWPRGLELSPADASRLSVFMLTSGLEDRLQASLQDSEDRMRLDKLIVTGRNTRGNIPQGLMSCTSLEVSRTRMGTIMKTMHGPGDLPTMDRLTSITLFDVDVHQVQGIFVHLALPRLRTVTLSAIHTELHHDEDFERPFRHDGLKTMAIAYCSLSVWRLVLNTWRTSSLTSLTLGLEARCNDESSFEWKHLPRYLYHFLLNLPELRDLAISVTRTDPQYYKFIWDESRVEGLVPRLRTLRVTSKKKCVLKAHRVALAQAVILRSREPNCEYLEAVVISRFMVEEEDEGRLSDCVGRLVLLDDSYM